MRVRDQVALVTGASAGIGRAVAQGLAARGAHTLVHGRNQARTREVAERVGGTALIADLAQADQVDRLAQDAIAVHGRVDLLIACAGIGWSGPFAQMPEACLEQVLAVDLVGPVRLARRLVPGMVERGSGHLVFVGSVAGRTGVAGEAAYAAAKAGLDVFAESLRLELRGSGVTITEVLPGAVDTGFFASRGRPYDRRLPRPVSAAAVARTVVSAVEQGRDEVWVPGWLRAGAVVRALAPGLYRALSARYGEPVRDASDGGP